MEKQKKKNSAAPWGKWSWCCNIILQTLVSCVIAYVVLWSANRLVTALFPTLQLWGRVFVFGVAVTAGSSIWNRICSERFSKKWPRHVGNLLLFAMLGIVLFWVAHMHVDQLEQGFWYVGQLIEEKINHYKGIRDAVAVQGGNAQESCGIMFLSLSAAAVFLVLQTVAAERKKGVWLALLPVSVVIFGLCVGKGPDFTGLAGTIVCLILLASVSWNRKKKLGMSGLLTGMLVASLVLSVAVCAVAADWFASKEEQVLPVQKKMEQQIMKLFSGASDVQNGKISNKYPKYTGEEVLHIQASEKQENTLYLRGTYADTYEAGKWTRKQEFTLTADQFSKYKDCPDLDPVMAVADESSRKYLDLLESGASLVGYGLTETLYDIKYTNLKSDIVYLPYGLETDTMTAGDTPEGDYQFRKKKSDLESSVMAIGGSAEVIMNNVMLSDICYNYEQTFSKYGSFYEAYNHYVEENYLDVPENMTFLKKMTDKLRSESEYGSMVENLDHPDRVNATRLDIANAVTSVLQMSYSYQKNIPDSGDMDPVEFFLKKGNGGFCVHFASAGVLILRELGVPARYVSGYKVDASEFKKDTSQDGYEYECSVPDSDAHAWVEIYLDNYGWIPVEMTPTAEESAQLDKLRNQANSSEQDTTAAVPAQDNQNSQETQPADQPAQNEMTASDAQGGQASGGGKNGTGGNGQAAHGNTHIDWKNTAKVFIPVVVAAVVLFLIFREKKRRAARWQRELERAEKSGRYSKAARMLNQKFYRWLVKNKKLSGKRMKDREYAEHLQKLYPEQDWMLYLQMLQKAVYADAELTEDEYVTLETMIRTSMSAPQK